MSDIGELHTTPEGHIIERRFTTERGDPEYPILMPDEVMPFVPDDGGRVAAGFQGHAGDCVTRSIAIACELPYREVYDALAAGEAARGKPRSARNGINRKVYDAYLESLGWEWEPTMRIGSGCTVHMRPDELPPGRLVVRLSRHLTAVVDWKVHDTYDPSRSGTRCVYGYWQQG